MEIGKTLCPASFVTRQNTGNLCKTELSVAVDLAEKKLCFPLQGSCDF